MDAHKINFDNNTLTAEGHVTALRCPHCRHIGAFPTLTNCNDIRWTRKSMHPAGGIEIWSAGMRRCPNPQCMALVFVLLCQGKVYISYPPEVIDFDSSNLPLRILETLEEAIKAHAAGCYKASALMVRRVLEELCRDKAAQGKDLKARLAALGNSIVIPQELLDGADDLRLLGNDAAHVEAKAYDDVGENEATVAIELAKELLKAVYQYSSLVAKLKALRKP